VPTNELKIDKTFSDRFAEPKTYAILSNIIGLAKRLNIRLVVEGLETAQQIDTFTELGVERLQGWAISEPLSLPDLLNSVPIEPEMKLTG
jgi:EAL domain-containing protein (putative c-di-GMP-specific phosphodiesterase class I)